MSNPVGKDIKAVMFDFDDTLVGTRVPIWRLHRHIAKAHYGVDLEEEILLKHWGQPIRVLVEHYYGATDIDAALALVKQETVNFPKKTFPQAAPALRKLNRAGKILGIVSASHLSILKHDMDRAGIPADIIDYIQTSEDTPVHKPNPAVFDPMLAWAHTRGIDAREILYIGDGIQDMIAATKAGMNFIGVTTGLATREDFLSHGSASIADLSELQL